MWSVQFQVVPCSTLYFFSRSIVLSNVVNANYRVLICCTCSVQSQSLSSVYFGFFCLLVSSVSNFRPDTGGGGGHLSRLTCPVVLWGGRNTASKYHWHVWGARAVSEPLWVWPRSRCVCFPYLHCSGSRLLCWGMVSGGPWVVCTP